MAITILVCLLWTAMVLIVVVVVDVGGVIFDNDDDDDILTASICDELICFKLTNIFLRQKEAL